MARKYIEQIRITGFDSMTYAERRAQVRSARTAELLSLQRAGNTNKLRQAKKNYAHTNAYIHLTHSERWAVINGVADKVASWGRVRLFAECINKVHFDPVRAGKTVEEQAFEQIVSSVLSLTLATCFL